MALFGNAVGGLNGARCMHGQCGVIIVGRYSQNEGYLVYMERRVLVGTQQHPLERQQRRVPPRAVPGHLDDPHDGIGHSLHGTVESLALLRQELWQRGLTAAATLIVWETIKVFHGLPDRIVPKQHQRHIVLGMVAFGVVVGL